MTTCAVVQLSDSTVINIVIAEITDLPPEECQLVEILPEIVCAIGATWDGVTFTLPIALESNNTEEI